MRAIRFLLREIRVLTPSMLRTAPMLLTPPVLLKAPVLLVSGVRSTWLWLPTRLALAPPLGEVPGPTEPGSMMNQRTGCWSELALLLARPLVSLSTRASSAAQGGAIPELPRMSVRRPLCYRARRDAEVVWAPAVAPRLVLGARAALLVLPLSESAWRRWWSELESPRAYLTQQRSPLLRRAWVQPGV